MRIFQRSGLRNPRRAAVESSCAGSRSDPRRRRDMNRAFPIRPLIGLLGAGTDFEFRFSRRIIGAQGLAAAVTSPLTASQPPPGRGDANAGLTESKSRRRLRRPMMLISQARASPRRLRRWMVDIASVLSPGGTQRWSLIRFAAESLRMTEYARQNRGGRRTSQARFRVE